MLPRRLIAWLLALIVPLTMTLVAAQASRAATTSPPAAVADATPGCHQPAAPAPTKAPQCRPECPLACAPIQPDRSAVAAPIRPYARLHFDLSSDGLHGRDLQPELPPPRTRLA